MFYLRRTEVVISARMMQSLRKSALVVISRYVKKLDPKALEFPFTNLITICSLFVTTVPLIPLSVTVLV